MNARIILYLYLSFSVLEFLWERFLSWLNARNVRKHADAVPPEFRNSVPEEVYRKSVQYTLAKGRFSFVFSAVTTAFVLALVVSGGLGRLESLTGAWNVHPYVRGLLYFFMLALMFRLLSIPFSLYSHFVLEERFGFNKMTIKTFVADELKSLLISGVLLTPLLLGVFWFMDFTGPFWWLFAFLLVTAFQALVMVLYPVVIAPLFNKFKPLDKGTLEEKISTLAEKLSFRMKGIFVMDGSKRSGHSNAFFAGFGKAKRIVLFDTLINSLSEDQVVSVLAHEIGHEKKRHILKGLLLTIALMAVLFALLGFLRDYEPLYRAFGFGATSSYALLVILSFASSPFTFFLTPLASMWSRKHEYEADRFAADAVGTSEHLSGALLTLGKDNLSNLTPHPLYSFFYYSHPSLAERLRALERRTGSAA